ncbi:carboxymuconolactone decarboxylase family protein [Streptomyces sp. NPDC001978]|uniref:carboxymuconolactone decarboxylase family protein n=1 Tax=Streptomyces sp. NPDC001978 TaxID=3364627 RepID=UPI0036B1418D
MADLTPTLAVGYEARPATADDMAAMGVLEPKAKELVHCAFDAAASHLYVPGLKLHMRNALRHGATTEEIMEVLEIAGVIGIHTATVAAPILAEELAAAESA